jgi:hypothetical protein
MRWRDEVMMDAAAIKEAAGRLGAAVDVQEEAL